MKDIRRAVLQGEVVVGTFSLASHPSVVEMIGYAGFDFVIIDTEHGTVAPKSLELENLIRAAYAANITPFVRTSETPTVVPGEIEKSLDFGAKGIVIPFVETKEEAAAAVMFSHYPPEGNRGGCPPVRATGYGLLEIWEEYRRRSNKETIIMPVIESRRGVDNIDEIVSVDGLDGILFGPFDLSMRLGLKGIQIHPKITVCRKKVYAACKRKGLMIADFGLPGFDKHAVEETRMMIKMGASIIAWGVDIWFLSYALRDGVKLVNEQFKALGGR